MNNALFHKIRHIHQIMIVDGGDVPEHLPEMINKNIDSLKKIYPRARYHLWSGEEIRDFIKDNFPADVTEVYDNLLPYAYKADLARYCLLSVYGGLYIDLGVRLMNAWDIPVRKGVAAFRDVPFVTASWTTIQNGLIWSLPNREEFSDIIERIVKNYHNRYYGLNPLYPTGPVLLGKVFARSMVRKGRANNADDQHIGSCRCITPDDFMLNVSYVSKEGKLIALRTKSGGGDLAKVGLYGTNNYNILWKNKRIYNEKNQTWTASDHSIELEGIAEREEKSIVVNGGKTGRISFGPFIQMEPGKYKLTVYFSDGTICERFKLDVCDKFGSIVICENEYNIIDNNICLHITNRELRDHIEFRTYALRPFWGGIERFCLEKIEDYDVSSTADSGATWVWTHDSEEIRTINCVKTVDGIQIKKGTRGRVTYGPYIKLHPGNYSFECDFGKETKFKKILLDIGGGLGNDTLIVCRVDQKKTLHCSRVNMNFNIERAIENVEFRLSVGKEFSGSIKCFKLTQISAT